MSKIQYPGELLLASRSPRRRQLIKMLDLPVVVAAASDGEDEAEQRYQGPVENLAVWLAKHKAAAALKLPAAAGRLVITADTTVILDGKTLGKPRDAAHAVELLRALRGRRHHVISGVVVCTQCEGKTVMHSGSCITPVLMRNYSDDEIAAYVASGDPLDKAGAYGIQNPSFQPTRRIGGCYFNVVGLPICTVVDLLAEFGVYPARRQVRENADCPWSEKCLI
ncbi:MAG TPA: Maf family protein [Ktedonobacteraceae bacterium]|nr:Maf family protein [Ktedonobacteraceae bacterium]